MKTTRMMGFLALVALGILFAPGAALATLGSNSGGGGGSFFDTLVVPNAQGTRFTGTIEMEWIAGPCAGQCREGATTKLLYNLHYVMRVNFNRTVHTFSNIEHGLCLSDVQSVVNVISGFVNSTVVPGLGLTGTATLRAVTNVADPPLSDPSNPANMIWLMFDFEYAVK